VNLKRFRPTFFASLAVAASALSVVSLTGCGSNNDPVKEDPAALAKRVDSANDLRKYYDEAQGNYEALSPASKDAVNKITGSEANTKLAFSHMSPNTPGAAGQGLPPSGG
jgi:hypothetical protein